MSALLLDTHVWIWLAAGDRRLAKQERMLNRLSAAKELLLSAVSIYEAARIGMETDSGRRRGKQAVRMNPTVHQWIRGALEGTRVMPIPLQPDAALDAATLHAMHPDPFDRLIVATATGANARLMTADAKIISFAKSVGVPLLEL